MVIRSIVGHSCRCHLTKQPTAPNSMLNYQKKTHTKSPLACSLPYSSIPVDHLNFVLLINCSPSLNYICFFSIACPMHLLNLCLATLIGALNLPYHAKHCFAVLLFNHVFLICCNKYEMLQLFIYFNNKFIAPTRGKKLLTLTHRTFRP